MKQMIHEDRLVTSTFPSIRTDFNCLKIVFCTPVTTLASDLVAAAFYFKYQTFSLTHSFPLFPGKTTSVIVIIFILMFSQIISGVNVH